MVSLVPELVVEACVARGESGIGGDRRERAYAFQQHSTVPTFTLEIRSRGEKSEERKGPR